MTSTIKHQPQTEERNHGNHPQPQVPMEHARQALAASCDGMLKRGNGGRGGAMAIEYGLVVKLLRRRRQQGIACNVIERWRSRCFGGSAGRRAHDVFTRFACRAGWTSIYNASRRHRHCRNTGFCLQIRLIQRAMTARHQANTRHDQNTERRSTSHTTRQGRELGQHTFGFAFGGHLRRPGEPLMGTNHRTADQRSAHRCDSGDENTCEVFATI